MNKHPFEDRKLSFKSNKKTNCLIFFLSVTDVTDVARPFDFVTDSSNLFRSILKKMIIMTIRPGEVRVIQN